ncbi:MAG: diguanylate cyclase [Thalassotalea sp.]|nr:diguanylate cyclase [Thalassotalea sp.]MDG2393021.1 diguanylate cyclase [Thalassotalea sp.]
MANHLSSSEIDALIKHSIEIRLSDRPQFNENLVLLESLEANDEQAQLSQKQRELILYLRGYAFAISGKNEQAIKIYKQFEHSSNSEIRVISLTAQLNMAILYNDYSNSFALIDSLLNDAATLDDLNLHKNNAYIMVGYFYNDLGKFQLALNYFSLINRSTMPSKELCTLAHHQALSYLGAKQVTANDEFILKSINDCNLIGEVIIANSLIIENANALIAEQQYDLAITSLLEHEQVILTGGFIMHNFSFHVLLTKAYTAQKKLLAANISASAALELIKNHTKTMYALELFDSLTDLYLLDNQPEKALNYAQQHHKTKQLIADIELRKKMASAMARHQTVEQSKKLKQLLIDNSSSIANDERLRQENTNLEQSVSLHFNIIIGLFLFCFILYGLTFWLKAYHQGLLNKAYKDPLTGLFSRRYFIDSLAGVIYQEKSLQQHLSLITLKLDDFHRINKDYGFEHGDYILKQMKVFFTKLQNEKAAYGRTGATEFCIALRNTDQIKAGVVANKLLQQLRILKSIDGTIDYKITASIGVSDTKICNYVPKNLLSDSNSAMQVARVQGKNQVVEFELSMSERSKYIIEDKLTYVF